MSTHPPTLQRIVIVGTTGSGKTTLARQLAGRLNCPHIELDALHWGPDWTPRDDFRARVVAAVAPDRWVADGNYRAARDIVWGRADTLVWLDYALPLLMWRLWRRSLRRLIQQETLWNDNRESWRGMFLSRDSLFVWQLQTYRRRQREYRTLPSLPKFAHLTVLRLRTPRATAAWLQTVPVSES